MNFFSKTNTLIRFWPSVLSSFVIICLAILVFAIALRPVDKESLPARIKVAEFGFEYGDQRLSLADALNRVDFKVSNSNVLNFGFDKRPIWIHFTVENRQNYSKTIYLEIDFPPLDDVEFYLVQDKREIAKLVSGDTISIDSRPFIGRNHIFPFRVTQNTTHNSLIDIYLRVESTSALTITPAFFTESQLNSHLNLENLIFGIFYGMILIMIVYSLGQFFVLHDRILIIYSTYITAIGCFLLVYNGHGFLYLYPNRPELNNLLNPLSLSCSIFLSILFSNEYLDLKKTQPFWNKIHLGLATISAGSIVAVFFLTTRTISIFLNIYLVAALCVILIVTIRGMLLQNLMAWFYFFSFSGFLMSGGLLVWNNLGFLEDAVNRIYTTQMAIAVEMLILGIGVSYRYRRLREEKDQLSLSNKFQSQQLYQLNHELELAREIQIALLPDKMPDLAGIKIMADYEPTGKLGGDYYDFISGHNEEVGTLIADVTGHGTPAALFASLVRYTFQTYSPYIADPTGLCEGMNRSIYGRTGTYFLTAGYLYISTKLSIARYASCGHPALIFNKHDGTLQTIKGRGKAIGIFESNRPETIEVKIKSSDRFFLYTDGLEEVIEKIKHVSVGDWFSRFRLEPMDAIQHDLHSLVNANRKSKNPIDDDITWILIEIE